MTRFRVGNIYKNLFLDFGGTYQEVIFRIVDSDYDHHKAYWEYQIEVLSPRTFHAASGVIGPFFWVRTPFLSGSEELPSNHPAVLLYGQK